MCHAPGLTLPTSPKSSAENLINDFLKYNGVQSVKIATRNRDIPTVRMLTRDGRYEDHDIPWYNAGGDIDKYYYFMSAQLEYEIVVTFGNGKKELRNTTLFQPFHRYYPLMAEVLIDRAILAVWQY